ncbi:MAG: hypothetical protein ACRCSK_07565 [Fusobacteriaceae bacterium]
MKKLLFVVILVAIIFGYFKINSYVKQKKYVGEWVIDDWQKYSWNETLPFISIKKNGDNFILKITEQEKFFGKMNSTDYVGTYERDSINISTGLFGAKLTIDNSSGKIIYNNQKFIKVDRALNAAMKTFFATKKQEYDEFIYNKKVEYSGTWLFENKNSKANLIATLTNFITNNDITESIIIIQPLEENKLKVSWKIKRKNSNGRIIIEESNKEYYILKDGVLDTSSEKNPLSTDKIYIDGNNLYFKLKEHKKTEINNLFKN